MSCSLCGPDQKYAETYTEYAETDTQAVTISQGDILGLSFIQSTTTSYGYVDPQ